MARSVSFECWSKEVKRPCAAAVVRSLVYLDSEVAVRVSRVVCALALSETTMPDSTDSDKPTAVSQRQPIRVWVFFPLIIARTLDSGDSFDRGEYTCRRDPDYKARAEMEM